MIKQSGASQLCSFNGFLLNPWEFNSDETQCYQRARLSQFTARLPIWFLDFHLLFFFVYELTFNWYNNISLLGLEMSQVLIKDLEIIKGPHLQQHALLCEMHGYWQLLFDIIWRITSNPVQSRCNPYSHPVFALRLNYNLKTLWMQGLEEIDLLLVVSSGFKYPFIPQPSICSLWSFVSSSLCACKPFFSILFYLPRCSV